MGTSQLMDTSAAQGAAACNGMLSGQWQVPTRPRLMGIVSGNEAAPGLIRATITGPDWLTGGSFGPEASVIACVMNIAMTILLAKYFRKQIATTTPTVADQ